MSNLRFSIATGLGCRSYGPGPTSGLMQAAVVSLPDPAVDIDRAGGKGTQTAVFAGGCFWCTEAVFEQLIGVHKVISGFSGGDAASAHYEMVSSEKPIMPNRFRSHSTRRRYPYGQSLKVFFAVAHDPTTLNRQGPDWGKQYRSVIFYKDAEQSGSRKAYIKQLDDAKLFHKPSSRDHGA